MKEPLMVVSRYLKGTTVGMQCRRARELGFDGIEWFQDDGALFSPEEGKERADTAAAYGLCAGYHAPFLGSWNLGVLSGSCLVGVLESFIGTAATLAADHISIHMGSFGEHAVRSKALARIADALMIAAPSAEKKGVSLCLENTTVCFSKREIGAAMEDFTFVYRRVSSSALRMTLDTGHGNITGTLIELVRRFGARIANIHVSDNDGVKDLHLPPFQGTSPLNALVKILDKEGYRGPFTFEFPADDKTYQELIGRFRSF